MNTLRRILAALLIIICIGSTSCISRAWDEIEEEYDFHITVYNESGEVVREWENADMYFLYFDDLTIYQHDGTETRYSIPKGYSCDIRKIKV